MKVKTIDLKDIALDWAVVRCEVGEGAIVEIDDPHFYSTDWAIAGPIIEREGIGVERDDLGIWFASYDLSEDCAVGATGSTPLIAAMRCYVASKLGDEVEIPKELIK